jgi:hypothetical protein
MRPGAKPVRRPAVDTVERVVADRSRNFVAPLEVERLGALTAFVARRKAGGWALTDF